MLLSRRLLTIVRHFVWGTGLALLPFASAVAQACEGPRVFVLLDRVQALDGTSLDTLERGLRHVLGNRGLAGNVTALSMRSGDFEPRTLRQQCLTTLKPKSEMVEDAVKAAGLAIAQESKSVFQKLEERRVREKAAADYDRLLAFRLGLVEVLSQEVKVQATATGPDSRLDLLLSLAKLVKDSCSSTAACSFFVFSTLVDDRTRIVLSQDATDPLRLAELHANAMLNNLMFRQVPSSFNVTVWGIGRAAWTAGPIEPNALRKLGVYWTDVLRRLGASPIELRNRVD